MQVRDSAPMNYQYQGPMARAYGYHNQDAYSAEDRAWTRGRAWGEYPSRGRMYGDIDYPYSARGRMYGSFNDPSEADTWARDRAHGDYRYPYTSRSRTYGGDYGYDHPMSRRSRMYDDMPYACSAEDRAWARGRAWGDYNYRSQYY